MKTYFSQIGYFAHQVLERANTALVSGKSSRGIFLQPEKDWTLYVSLEKFRGPLTLNLEGDPSWLENVATGSPVKFTSREIHFSQTNISIPIQDIARWHPAPDPSARELIPEQVKSVLNLSKRIAAENPFLPLLFKNENPIESVPGIKEKIHECRDALKGEDLTRAADPLSEILGLGPGLTPVGDDFILGVLLTLNTGSHPILKEGSIQDLNQIIIQHALEKTTRLSTSLLACAVEGAADERLLKVLNGFYSAEALEEKDLQDLLAWGSSSGIAVLAGMIGVLS